MALAGIDIDAVMKGFAQAYEDLKNPDLHANPAYQYASPADSGKPGQGCGDVSHL